MTFNKISRLPVIGDLAGVYFVYNTDTPSINGIYVKSTNESAAIKIADVTETLNGSNYVMVYGTGTPEENKVELEESFNKASLLNPTISNVVSILVAPGDYGNPIIPEIVGIEIKSLTGCNDVIINGIGGYGNVIQLENDIYTGGVNKAATAETVKTLNENINAISTGLIYQVPVTNFTDLATTYPTPQLHWAAMVTTLGYIYTWNGTAWVSTGLREFPKNVVTRDMLTDKIQVSFADGINRLDVSKITEGFVTSDGSISTGLENFYHTDFIPVKVGDILVTNNDAGDIPQIVSYDTNFNKLSSVNSSVKKITITEDGYVRFSIYNTTGDFSNIVIANRFVLTTEYNPISGYVNKEDFINNNILFNLLNPENIYSGYLDSNGDIQTHPEFFNTGFIPVSSGETLYINNNAGDTPKILSYNSNFEKVSAVNSSVKQITASVDGYVRFSLYNPLGVAPKNATITKNYNPNAHIPYNPLEGYLNTTKKILWLGTSIPEGCEYPIVASANNGAICFNKAVGASGIVLNTGILGNGRDGKDLTETIAEKIERYSNSVDAETLELYKSWSYENLLIPYLSGENKVDAIVIDHGFNDRQWIANELADLSNVNFDITSTADRTTFTGAFKFLLNKIYTADPKMKVIIGGYIEKVSSTDKRYGSEIYTMHKKLSDVYGIPYLDVANFLNFTFNHVPNTSNFISDYNTANDTSYTNAWPDTDGNVTFFQYFNPDAVHPHTDKTGESNKRLNLIYTKLLRDLI